jgi:hypothetical protein
MAASGLSDDDDGKNDGLKWKLAESDGSRSIIFTASPLASFAKFKIRFFKSNSTISQFYFIFTSPAFFFLYALLS